MNLDWIKGKKAAVLGLGVSNLPLLDLLINIGADVSVRDRSVKDVNVSCRHVFGDQYLDCRGEDVIFRSPGIKPWEIIHDGAVLTGEMELFFDMCPCPIIGVTGSDGKTTTSTLIAEFLKAGGKTVHLGGNIGRPLLSDVGRMNRSDFAVVELSSFQLITMRKSPQIAVITNISPNHLDWHNDYCEYIAAKSNIYLWQKPGNRLIYGGNLPRFEVSPVHLLGEHNKKNFSAAAEAVRGIVGTDAIKQVAESFKGVEHRLEFVREYNGIRFYNSSIASGPSRTIADLRSFDEKVILIAGGKDKGVPFDELGSVIADRVKELILTGSTAESIKNAVIGYNAPPIHIIDRFEDAVINAASLAGSGDIVLLSPASTSFDRFSNFAERGNLFKTIVNNL